MHQFPTLYPSSEIHHQHYFKKPHSRVNGIAVDDKLEGRGQRAEGRVVVDGELEGRTEGASWS
jgi:hypothetical protein